MRPLLPLALALAGCAGAEPTAPAPVAPPAVARAAVATCAGTTVELDERLDDWSRHATLRCHPTGATIEVDEGGLESEGWSDERVLDSMEADALWAEIAALSARDLDCTADDSSDARRRLHVVGPRGARTFECARSGQAPRGWSAIERLLRGPEPAAVDESAWPFQADYWRDELRYAGAGR